MSRGVLEGNSVTAGNSSEYIAMLVKCGEYSIGVHPDVIFTKLYVFGRAEHRWVRTGQKPLRQEPTHTAVQILTVSTKLYADTGTSNHHTRHNPRPNQNSRKTFRTFLRLRKNQSHREQNDTSVSFRRSTE